MDMKPDRRQKIKKLEQEIQDLLREESEEIRKKSVLQVGQCYKFNSAIGQRVESYIQVKSFENYRFQCDGLYITYDKADNIVHLTYIKDKMYNQHPDFFHNDMPNGKGEEITYEKYYDVVCRQVPYAVS